MEDVGPTSLDSKKSLKTKIEKFREEAQYEKERGNTFVKQEKWDEAISCYNRAIELVKDDAIYYANRGLCHLKKESLHLAEADCTEALRIDPTYVKALQRRATAREKLGSLRAATNDLNEVLKLEPHNVAAKKQLQAIKSRMGTKGSKSKSSPQSTPTIEARPITTSAPVKILEFDEQLTISSDVTTSPQITKVMSPEEKWMKGVSEPITVVNPVKKPPHLRSKRALKPIKIKEIPLGQTSPEKPPTRIKIIEVEEDTLAKGDSNNNSNANNVDETKKVETKQAETKKAEEEKSSQLNSDVTESEKLSAESLCSEKCSFSDMVPPVNSVQFMAEWKYLKGKNDARSHYLSIIDPLKIPSIFENALESDVLSELLHILKDNKEKFKTKTIAAYLKGLVKVKRFSALAMFLSSSDKELIHKLLVHCRTVEGCSDDEIADLKNKFEL